MNCLGDSSSSTGVDFHKIWQAARSRWLRPIEIYDILMNSGAFPINKEPLNLPPSGTLVLFNRKLLRNFRRDGHPWRKKKDNRTVKEAHEHLKVGSEEKIHVYYAHGEEGLSNLQRRAYWLLDKTLEHIVLVHYLEVKEGMKNSTQISFLPNIQNELQIPHNPSLSPLTTDFNSSLSSATPDRRAPLDFGDFTSYENDDFDDKFSFDDFQSTENIVPEQGEWHSGGLATDNKIQFSDDKLLISQQLSSQFQDPVEIQASPPQSSSLSSSITTTSNIMELPQNEELNSHVSWQGIGEVFKKLDSLERWMERELPGDTNSPMMDSNSCSDMDSPMQDEIQNRVKESVSLQSPERQAMPAHSQIYFEIKDFSPTWTFTSEETKVIIIGKFCGDICDISKMQWYCMFDDVEVPAEIVQPGVFRCISPEISNPGTVSFCIINRNRQVFSDSKHFEVISRPENQKKTLNLESDQVYTDLNLQCRLTQLLLQNNVSTCAPTAQRSQLGVASNPSRLLQLMQFLNQEWVTMGNLSSGRASTISEIKEQLLQMFFECKLMDNICTKPMLNGKKRLDFDKEGQTAFHLAAALGYEWVIDIIVDSEISLDFRDKAGWTSLHWAAFYGREQMVASLLAAGAKPGTVSDPTPENPSGCTPADIAASRGYDGLAGYLSEKALICHLNTLTLEENNSDKRSAEDEGQRVVEYLRRSQSLRRSIKTREDEVIFEETLSAVGQATTTSGRIQAAFRTYFLRERLHAIEEADEYGFSLAEQLAVRKLQRAYRRHQEQKRKEDAALQIQNRFRGWKIRKDFVNLRKSAVKIQAFFRMHQARKQYHRLVWSVGVLEKAVLRWRQRRKGLRGYQVEANQVQSNDDFLMIGRKQAEDSVERAAVLVQSMVKSGSAREQYKRMQENFKQAQLASDSSTTSLE